jgi:hypothetical protein
MTMASSWIAWMSWALVYSCWGVLFGRDEGLAGETMVSLLVLEVATAVRWW